MVTIRKTYNYIQDDCSSIWVTRRKNNVALKHGKTESSSMNSTVYVLPYM